MPCEQLCKRLHWRMVYPRYQIDTAHATNVDDIKLSLHMQRTSTISNCHCIARCISLHCGAVIKNSSEDTVWTNMFFIWICWHLICFGFVLFGSVDIWYVFDLFYLVLLIFDMFWTCFFRIFWNVAGKFDYLECCWEIGLFGKREWEIIDKSWILCLGYMRQQYQDLWNELFLSWKTLCKYEHDKDFKGIGLWEFDEGNCTCTINHNLDDKKLLSKNLRWNRSNRWKTPRLDRNLLLFKESVYPFVWILILS